MDHTEPDTAESAVGPGLGPQGKFWNVSTERAVLRHPTGPLVSDEKPRGAP